MKIFNQHYPNIWLLWAGRPYIDPSVNLQGTQSAATSNNYQVPFQTAQLSDSPTPLALFWFQIFESDIAASPPNFMDPRFIRTAPFVKLNKLNGSSVNRVDSTPLNGLPFEKVSFWSSTPAEVNSQKINIISASSVSICVLSTFFRCFSSLCYIDTVGHWRAVPKGQATAWASRCCERRERCRLPLQISIGFTWIWFWGMSPLKTAFV